MTSLVDALMYAIEKCPMLGKIAPISALSTTTATLSAPFRLGESPTGYANQYLYRFGATSIDDTVRQITAYVGSTGVITHAGANYTDTTATNEQVVISPFDPYTIRFVAQEVLRTTKRVHWDTFPAHGGDRYYLDQFSWIRRKTDIARLLYRRGPFLGRNMTFDDWNVVSSAGALEPDVWTKSGTSSTWSRVATNPFQGAYECALVRSTNDASVFQYVGAPNAAGGRSLLFDGVQGLPGEKVSVLAIVRSSLVSTEIGAYVADGVGTTTDTSQTVVGAHQELTVERTIDDAATKVEAGITVTSDGTVNISKIAIVRGEITDAVRRDIYERSETDWDFEEGAAPRIRPAHRAGVGECYEIATRRPYPTLDETRLRAGSADNDDVDIAVDLWAFGLLAGLFEAYAAKGEEYAARAAMYRPMFDSMRLANLTDERPRDEVRESLGGFARRA